jgi:hypothetical protein
MSHAVMLRPGPRGGAGEVAGAAFALVLGAVAVARAQPTDPPIGGVYEAGIGTRASDVERQLAYWKQFGFTPGAEGSLGPEQARALYGVDSALRSIRLLHQDADHGLLRLLVWEKPTGEGLGLAPMKVRGGRWTAMLTADVYNLLNHAEDARAAGLPVHFVPPQKQIIYRVPGTPRPFLDAVPYVREMALIQPLTRQILFQRFSYSLPLYGRIARDSFFRSSQVTHFGLVTTGGPEPLDFYDRVLGLLRVRTAGAHESSYEQEGPRNIFGLLPGERYFTADFDDPRSSPSDPQQMRSGRLKICRFPADVAIPDRLSQSRPGALGYTLYTIRARGLVELRRRVEAGGASGVTGIRPNEFGESSFSFVAPDGYFWTLIER